MKNFSVDEKSKGILIFANNTETVDYVSIANKTLALAKHSLGIDGQVVSNSAPDGWNNRRVDTDSNSIVHWNNYSRYQAYELSPYDQTLVIDADYLVTTPHLLKLFNSGAEYLLCNTNHMLKDNTIGSNTIDPIWATVFYFDKSESSRNFFDLVGRVQRNYDYYRLLLGIREAKFRNDTAFAIANVIANGYNAHRRIMPWAITTADYPVQSIDIDDQWMVVRASESADILPRQDLHVMSKLWLQSNDFDNFVKKAMQ